MQNNSNKTWIWYILAFVLGLLLSNLFHLSSISNQQGAVIDANLDIPSPAIN